MDKFYPVPLDINVKASLLSNSEMALPHAFVIKLTQALAASATDTYCGIS